MKLVAVKFKAELESNILRRKARIVSVWAEVELHEDGTAEVYDWGIAFDGSIVDLYDDEKAYLESEAIAEARFQNGTNRSLAERVLLQVGFRSWSVSAGSYTLEPPKFSYVAEIGGVADVDAFYLTIRQGDLIEVMLMHIDDVLTVSALKRLMAELQEKLERSKCWILKEK